MKEILISIHPKWCSKIVYDFFGRKTIELRKSKPNMKTPFKCYIYMTSGGYEYHDPWTTCVFTPDNNFYNGAQRIIGEFICDKVDEYIYITDHQMYNISAEERKQMRLEVDEIETYGDGKTLYGWHISNLILYKNPKELKDFGKARPPQSWCYVEKLLKEEKNEL